MIARVDVPHPTPALQPDVPDPAMLLRGIDTVYGMMSPLLVVMGDLHGQRTIDEQNIAAIHEGHAHRVP